MPDDEPIISELYDIERLSDDQLEWVVAGILIAYGADNGNEDLIARRDKIFAEMDKRTKMP